MKKKGFTLIELMIVVAIIAILAAAALPAFGDQIKKSRDGKAIQMMGNMRSQLSMLSADMEGYWPAPASDNLSLVFVEQDAKIAVASTAEADAAMSSGIQGFTTTAGYQVTGDGVGKMKCGTSDLGTYVTWTYDEANGKTSFDTDNGADTKNKAWEEY